MSYKKIDENDIKVLREMAKKYGCSTTGEFGRRVWMEVDKDKWELRKQIRITKEEDEKITKLAWLMTDGNKASYATLKMQKALQKCDLDNLDAFPVLDEKENEVMKKKDKILTIVFTKQEDWEKIIKTAKKIGVKPSQVMRFLVVRMEM